MREEVQAFVVLGPLPSEDDDEVLIDLHEQYLSRIVAPVTDEEACALVGMFGPDGCYGLTWSLLHLIETAPGWLVEACLHGDNMWVALLRQRLKNQELQSRVVTATTPEL